MVNRYLALGYLSSNPEYKNDILNRNKLRKGHHLG